MVIQFPHYALYKNGPNQVGSNVPQTKEEILNQSLKIEQRKRDWVRNRYEEVPLDVPRGLRNLQTTYIHIYSTFFLRFLLVLLRITIIIEFEFIFSIF